MKDQTKRPLSSSAVRALLKRDDIGGPHIASQEDPYCEVLVQSISFFGGDYLVSPGFGEGTVGDVENLADAAFRSDWMPQELRVPALHLIQGLLIVSNLVLTRAGLSRGTLPGRAPGGPIEVPSASRIEELARAAFVSHDDLESHSVWLPTVVDTFALDPGQLTEPCDDAITEDRLFETPFLRVEGGYQVTVPLDLLLTVRYHLLRLAHQKGLLEQLGSRYRAAALRRVERLLPPCVEPRLLSRDGVMDRYLFSLDHATDLHLICATDSLSDWTPDNFWGSYDNQAAMERLNHLVSAGERAKYSKAETVFHLVIADSPGRFSSWGVTSAKGADPMLVARADDLEIILHSERDGVLGLLYFAEALDRFPCQIVSTNILDQYTCYVGNGRSFYLSDEALPDAVVFEVGDGYFERAKFFEESDRHGVQPPLPGSPVVQAVRQYKSDAPEIYFVGPSASFEGFVVEAAGVEVYICPDPSSEDMSGSMALLLEAVAYWVRECIVNGALTPKTVKSHVVVSTSQLPDWTEEIDSFSSVQSVIAARGEDSLTLRFTDRFVFDLGSASNLAERGLVEALLAHLFALEADISRFVDLIAPLGPKRMINAFTASKSPELSGERLPPPQTGHDQVTAQILDALGEWLRHPEGGGCAVGSLLGMERTKVLNKAVGHLFKLLEAELERYKHDALLDHLTAQHEALIRSAHLEVELLSSRVACFGAEAETTRQLVDHRRRGVIARRALGFLIEYVAAQPPTGDRELALRDYNWLLAVAAQIIHLGTASDFLHYNLADFEISILPSGRLGTSRDEPIDLAIEAYAEAAGQRAIQAALAPPADRGEVTSDLSILHESAEAMRSEFGFTFEELRDVCGGLLDLGVGEPVTRIPRSDAIDEIVNLRGMPQDVVDTVLCAITLEKRSAFMSIGPDAVPWRFNRNMSYVRRPLVLQGEELVFGLRSLIHVGYYWYSGLTSGRLQATARTQPMKKFISRARRRINAAFADEVGRRLAGLGLDVRVSVNKVAGRRITDACGLDLGDIDILAWHPPTRSFVAVEAKDFEVAKTPAEISHEIVKLFNGRSGKRPQRSSIEKHKRRLAWLEANLSKVLPHFGLNEEPGDCQVSGVVVTSEPLVSPLARASEVKIVPFPDLTLDALGLGPNPRSKKSSNRPRRH